MQELPILYFLDLDDFTSKPKYLFSHFQLCNMTARKNTVKKSKISVPKFLLWVSLFCYLHSHSLGGGKRLKLWSANTGDLRVTQIPDCLRSSLMLPFSGPARSARQANNNRHTHRNWELRFYLDKWKARTEEHQWSQAPVIIWAAVPRGRGSVFWSNHTPSLRMMRRVFPWHKRTPTGLTQALNTTNPKPCV